MPTALMVDVFLTIEVLRAMPVGALLDYESQASYLKNGRFGNIFYKLNIIRIFV
jgi:hypothetical protein